jgi:hypothetical protein
LCIDTKCLSPLDQEVTNGADDENCDSLQTMSNNQALKAEVKVNVKPEQQTSDMPLLTKSANSCRVVLQEIRDMTYLCSKPKALIDLQHGLQSIKQIFKTSLLREMNSIHMRTNCPSLKVQPKSKIK